MWRKIRCSLVPKVAPLSAVLVTKLTTVTGVDAVNMLRDYIDVAYGGYYGTNRADLFIGQNAAWDADELVALLRCVVANPQTLNGKDSVEGLFSREDNNNQRKIDMFRFAGTLFGVRGLESRQDYLYVGHDGKLHDARQEEATYVALERMNAMVRRFIPKGDSMKLKPQIYLDDICFKINSMPRKIFDSKCAYDVELDYD